MCLKSSYGKRVRVDLVSKNHKNFLKLKYISKSLLQFPYYLLFYINNIKATNIDFLLKI